MSELLPKYLFDLLTPENIIIEDSESIEKGFISVSSKSGLEKQVLEVLDKVVRLHPNFVGYSTVIEKSVTDKHDSETEEQIRSHVLRIYNTELYATATIRGILAKKRIKKEE